MKYPIVQSIICTKIYITIINKNIFVNFIFIFFLSQFYTS
ncbi:hypothetical protein CLOBAR_02781 [Intestinibacter bartlettii DSM 16795]|nr:hypothetical protein CLOBAR_02781 [Intestinibacter bartlettii DSM 16795]